MTEQDLIGLGFERTKVSAKEMCLFKWQSKKIKSTNLKVYKYE